MKLGLYTRISRDPNGTSEAPGRQEDACRDWAARNGHEIVAVYEDRDISGYKNVDRPQFNQLLAAAGKSVDGILCWRIDRLLRNWRDWAKLDTLLDSGVILLTEDGTDSRRDAAILAIKVAFAKEESRKMSERLVAQRTASALDGRRPYGGRRAFGYTREREIVEAEAAEIRAAASLLLAGGSVSAIVRDWNLRGLPTPAGGQWQTSVFRWMIKSPTIAGYRVHRGQAYPAQWPPILSESQHRALQSLFRARATGAPVRQHFPSGLLLCARCGSRMGANRHQYRCGGCAGSTVLIRHVETALANALQRRSLRKAAAEQPDFSGEIEEKERAVQRWDEEFAFGTMDKFAYRRIREQLVEEVAQLQRKQENTSFQLPADFENWWPPLSLLEKSIVARRMIKSVTVAGPGRGKRAYDETLFTIDWR